jgi:hypothetical protein
MFYVPVGPSSIYSSGIITSLHRTTSIMAVVHLISYPVSQKNLFLRVKRQKIEAADLHLVPHLLLYDRVPKFVIKH